MLSMNYWIQNLMKQKITNYKIQDSKTGLFSNGGINSNDFSNGGKAKPKSWSINGKVWQNIGHLKNHLNLFKEYGKHIPDTWQIIELVYTIEMVSAKTLTIKELD